jgi:hypothetical protein
VQLSGDRAGIRQAAVWHALTGVRQRV